MADQDAALDLDGDGLDEEDITAGVKRKKLSGKKLVLFGGIGLLVLGLLGGGAQYFGLFSGGGESTASHGESGHGGSGHGGEGGDSAGQSGPGDVVFYDLPEMLVTLNSSGSETNYLKLTVTLELDNPKNMDVLEKRLPRIIDNFQVYLRELRLEDLEGSAGLSRLKEELLVRVNAAVGAPRVKDVLFKQMLVQ